MAEKRRNPEKIDDVGSHLSSAGHPAKPLLINRLRLLTPTSQIGGRGSSHHWAGIFSVIKSFVVIVKIVIPALTGLAFFTGP